jgi:hypothetical protein
LILLGYSLLPAYFWLWVELLFGGAMLGGGLSLMGYRA